MTPAVAGIGTKRLVAGRNKARLYRYDGVPRYGTPVLFVPNLGISRPWIFERLPGGSFIESLVHAGFDVYVLDWGVFGPEDHDLTFEECLTGTLAPVCRTVLETSRAPTLSVIGYCMGTALTLSLAASRPELPLRAFVDMAGPVDFSRAGLLARWLDRRFFDVDRLVDTLGSIPAPLIWLGGTLVQPTMGLSAVLELSTRGGGARRVGELWALARWVRDFVGIPGEFFRQWVREFYQDNLFYRGQLSVGGRPAPPGAITCPVLAVAATDDPIAPVESVRALLDVVGSADKEWLEVSGSHLSLVMGDEARARLWPAIARWLAARE